MKLPTFTINHPDDARAVIKLVYDFVKREWPGYAIDVVIKRHSKARSIPQNATFHGWCEEAAKFFVANGRTHWATGKEINKETMKENLKSTFLGTETREYEDVSTGVVRSRIETRHTADLEVGEMHFFMTLVDQWAAENGIPITRPVNSDYMKWASEMGNAV